MQRISFDIAGCTDIGSVRELNEDSCLTALTGVAGPSGVKAILAVSDGMGGHHAGDVASKIACEYLEHLFAKGNYQRFAGELGIAPNDYSTLLREAFHAINRKIIDRAVSFNLFRTMGCTCVVGLVVYDADAARWSLIVGSIGDSRCYVMRKNELLLATEDDSYVWELYKKKEISYGEVRLHPKRNVLTQALGIHETINPHIYTIDLERGDAFLVCSDGLHAIISEKEMKQELLAASGAEEAAKRLVRKVNGAGAKDNVAVAVGYCRTHEQESTPRSVSRNLSKVLAAALPLAFLGIGSFVLLNSPKDLEDSPVPYVLAITKVPESALKDSLLEFECSVEPYDLIQRQKELYGIVRSLDGEAIDTLRLVNLDESERNSFVVPFRFSNASAHRVGLVLVHRTERRPLYTSLVTIDVKQRGPSPLPALSTVMEEEREPKNMLRLTRGQDGYMQVWLEKDTEVNGELNAQISSAGVVEILALNKKHKIIPRSSSIEYRIGETVHVRMLETGRSFTEVLQ